jgi:hypothetical protein
MFFVNILIPSRSLSLYDVDVPESLYLEEIKR